MNFQIKEVLASDTWQIRHQVMWPNEPIDSVKLKNDNQGEHFGLFVDTKLVSVVSLFTKEKSAQFRKFATLHEEQGKGYGTALLQFIFGKVQESTIQHIWCNARLDKTKFYTRFGMEKTDQQFSKSGIEYIIMEKKLKTR